MNRATARRVDSVIHRTWQFKEELPRATPARIGEAQEELKQLLARVSESHEKAEQLDFLDLAYPLACWIDEQMLGDPRIGKTWSEALLEEDLYGTGDREWLFWKQAELAEMLGDGDALQVFCWCVAHGFTGSLRNDPRAVDDWLRRVQERIARTATAAAPFPATMTSPPDVVPLHGRRAMLAMLRTGWAASLVLLPTLSYIGVRLWVR